jgi:outer membrane protein assembly factor BamE (lipoprotein component of BamABCDE complex)
VNTILKCLIRILVSVLLACILWCLYLYVFSSRSPVSPGLLESLNSTMTKSEVENLLGSPSSRQENMWVYRDDSLWAGVQIYFTNDGRFQSYEIDY